MQDEIVRERRISVDAAWLGRNDLLRMIFSPAAAWRELSDWLLRVVAAVARTPYEGDDRRQRVEFLAVISEEISKLRNSLDECDIELTTEVYTSLLRRHLQTVRIPYEGEPLEGVQVMGILETRNLDFENVVLLSMNDDNFPGNHMAQASFVPYNLRAAYGLPTRPDRLQPHTPSAPRIFCARRAYSAHNRKVSIVSSTVLPSNKIGECI